MSRTWLETVRGQLFGLLAPRIRLALEHWVRTAPTELVNGMEEWRLRIGQAAVVNTTGGHLLLPGPQGSPLVVEGQDLQQTLQLMTEYSPYARQEQMKNLYLPLPGGHRVGLTGEVVLENNCIKLLQHISSMNIRLARAVPGCADRVITRIMVDGRPGSTLVVSPPGCGKTTLLRDLARLASNGLPGKQLLPSRVGIVDERSEIASCVAGVPQHDVGSNTDVLDACPKAQGMQLLVRAMNPQLLIVDEIGSPHDTEAILDALKAGVRLIATVHGRDLADIRARPQLRLFTASVPFAFVVILSRRHGPGTVECIIPGHLLQEGRGGA